LRESSRNPSFLGNGFTTKEVRLGKSGAGSVAILAFLEMGLLRKWNGNTIHDTLVAILAFLEMGLLPLIVSCVMLFNGWSQS